MTTATYNRDYTMYQIDKEFNGSTEVIIKTKVLTSFTGKDGKQVKGALEVMAMLLQQGIISSFEVDAPEVGEDGKLVYSIKMNGFDPSVQSQTKEGKTFRWFKGCYNKLQFLKRVK